MADITVIKRDGSYEEFEVDKISDSIMGAAMEVGGEDIELADELADLVLDILESNEIEEIEAADLQRLVEKTLIEEGHAATATQYILKGADRSRMREMDSALMKSFEEITFKSEAESDVKRENANIDSSTAMGTMLKYGSEGAKKFNLLYMMSEDISRAHINCDIHIHDLDFLALTETCISKDTNLVVKFDRDGKEVNITAEELYNKLNTSNAQVNEVINTVNSGLQIQDGYAFYDVYNMVAHRIDGKQMLKIDTHIGSLKVTNDHLVSVCKSGAWVDIEASDLVVGDELATYNHDTSITNVKITQITPISYDELVYDLQTQTQHFNANGFRVHNCLQIPLDKLFKGGFNTGHGYLREPGNIRTAGALAAIAIQSNQNDQHGGQSIPMFDYYLAPYVALTYVKRLAELTRVKFDLTKEQYKELKEQLIYYRSNQENLLVMNDACIKDMKELVSSFLEENNIKSYKRRINKLFDNAHEETYDETFQSMEAFIHNLNTMHSRAGAQVPFSSINYGTDTSTEGRMVMECVLKTTEDGLGNGETPIFPIQIWKLRAGTSFNPGDTNYDLYELACRVSAKRLYPNFVNLDAPYNAALYKEGHPETEMATMGCRTRVGTNVHDPDKAIIPGRGNLSFTTINLPRLGIKAQGNIDTFFKLLDEKLELVHRQLLERFEIQCKKHPLNYPFLMGQGCWLGSEYLGPNDDIREILKHGTLTVGFIGLAETLVALTGKHHGESEESQELGLKIVQHMRDYTDAWSQEEHMNYSVIGTPAEGLSGRFVKADKKVFGTIPGVTDRDYYTNSSHVPVYYPISATKKIEVEAKYHFLENGGAILYIELEGDPSKNIKAFMRLIQYMHDAGAGYMAINHQLDRDPVCLYKGIIGDVCPRCGRREGEAMTMEMWMKIKGYANVGNADTLGYHGDPYEEEDRMPNTLN